MAESYPDHQHVPFPVDASPDVRSCRVFVPVVSGVKPARLARSGIAAQLGALAVLDNLKSLHLVVSLQAHHSFEAVERPSAVLTSTIRMIASRARDMALTVAIDASSLVCHRYALRALVSAIEPVLLGLANARIQCMTLRNFYEEDQESWVGPNHEGCIALREVAGRIDTLCLQDAAWITGMVNPIMFGDLRTLIIEIGVHESPGGGAGAELQEYLLHFINESAAELVYLSVTIGPWLMTDFEPLGVPLACPKLRELYLLGDSLERLHSYVVTLPCETFVVQLRTPQDWASMRSLITRSPWPFPHLSVVRIRWSPKSDQWQVDIESFSDIRGGLQAHGVSVKLEVVRDEAGFTAQEMMGWLSTSAQDLVSLSSQFFHTEEPDLLPYPITSRLALPNLADLEVIVVEGLLQENESACYTVAEFYRRIRAPKVERLRIDFTTPYSEYLPALQQAVADKGPFPNLRSIAGRYMKSGGWNDNVSAHRRRQFVAVCAQNGIALDDLTWEESI